MPATPSGATADPSANMRQQYGKEADEMIKARLLAAARRPENTRCADCDSPNPKWATVTHGGFICTQCAGVHRSLGVHISFVLSTTLDKWTAEQVATVEAAGNELLNAALERSLDAQADAFAKPTADSPRDERERFIRAKYKSKQFASAVSSLSSVIDRQQMLQRQSAGRLCSSESTPSSAGSVQKQSSGDQRGMIEFVGVLQVALHEARELAGVNISGKSDPYVTLRLGEQTVSSQHVNNSVNPTWGETLLLSWDGASPLYVELFDHNAISADRSIGAFEVPLAQLQSLLASPAAAIDEWFDAKMSREWASNFGEHLVAGAEGVTRGFYRGITGVWKDPIKGAKEKGLEGFAKGVGKGVAGVFYRPIQGIGTMVKHTGLSVGVGKPRDDEEEELVPAGKVHLTLTLQRFT